MKNAPRMTAFFILILMVWSSQMCFAKEPSEETHKIPSANNPKEAVNYLIGAIDKSPGDQELLEQLGIDSIDIISSRLSTTTEPWHVLRGVYLLSNKFKQYEPQIDTAKKDQIVQLLVTHAELFPKGRAFDFLQGIRHPLVRNLALKYKDSQEMSARLAAERLLNSLNEAPKALTASSNASPTGPRDNSNAAVSQPKSSQGTAPPGDSPPLEESKPAWWIWGIGGALALTLVVVFLKKRRT